MQLTRESAEQRLHDFNMGDMPVMELRPTPTVVTSDWFTKYKKLCHEFTQSLTDSVDELALMNLTTDEFMGLIMGHAVPQNLSIRFRVPLTWGGKLELDNLFTTSGRIHNRTKRRTNRMVTKPVAQDIRTRPQHRGRRRRQRHIRPIKSNCRANCCGAFNGAIIKNEL